MEPTSPFTDIMEGDTDEDDKKFRSEVEKLSENIDDEAFMKLVSLAGITGTELPERMEKINEILDVIPDDMTEFILIEFLNDLITSKEEE